MFCKNCGKELNDTAKFCPACGTKVESKLDVEIDSKEKPSGNKYLKPIIAIACVAVIAIIAVVVIMSKSQEDSTPIAEEATNNSTEEGPVSDPKDDVNSTNVDEIFDAFLASEIPALNASDPTVTLYYSDLNNMETFYTSYEEGERVDLDNDGEKELIINGDYGGMYLDARDDKVYIFAEGDGTAHWLSHAYYDGGYLIVYSDDGHQGRNISVFERYSGADNLVETFELSAYYWDQDRYDESSEFIFRDKNITMQEYQRLNNEIFGKFIYDDSKLPFYGIWVYGSKDIAEAIEFGYKVVEAGYSPDIFLSSQWDNLNPEPYYVVSALIYDTEDAAKIDLEDIKKAGFEGAYIKFSGNYKGD